MGNINNPCINRWGVNSFWSHYWYTDMKYQIFIQQDLTFTTLLKIYLRYGAETPAVLWQDPLWYKSSTYTAFDELHYDCRWFVKHEIDLGYSIAYIIRNESSETFESRWTVLRFNQWFIINVSWFQPDKLKNKRKKRSTVVRQFLLGTSNKSRTHNRTKTVSRFYNTVRYSLYSKTLPQSTYLF